MKKNFLFRRAQAFRGAVLCAAMLFGTGTASADDFNGLLITAPGTSTTYGLIDVPTIIYSPNDDGSGVASISTISMKEPIKISLTKDQTLVAKWAIWKPSATAVNGVNADKVTTYTKDGKKYVTGGKLIIVGRDGKMYDADGTQVK